MHKSTDCNRVLGYSFLFVLIIFQTLLPLPSNGGALQLATYPEPIKANYKSWSLFLVCGPEWLLTENQGRLMNLYRQFGAFGRAIGPENLAVWFRKAQLDPNETPIFRGKQEPTLADYVDVNRSSQYCAKFQLLPSKSPYILVTTTYPDLDADTGDYVALSLSNATSSDITSLLNKLTDQLLVQGLNKEALDSEQYWRGWQRAYEAVKHTVGSLVRKTKLQINAKVLKLEIDGGRN
jgi:hypothetical protein